MEQFETLKDQKTRPKNKSKNESDSSDSEFSDDEEENREEEQTTEETNIDSNENQENPDQISEDSVKQLIFPPVIPDDYKLQMEQRKQRILSANPKNYLNIESEKHEMVIENTHVRELFFEVFGDKSYKEFPSFNHFFQQTYNLDSNIEINEWKPSPPQIFENINSNNYDEFIGYVDSSHKTSQFIHPVREKIGPKTCQVNTDEQIFWLTHEEVLIQREFKVSKVPMADCFTQQNFYHLQQAGPTTVKLTFGFHINFVKSSMFKSLIRNSSSSENRDTWNNKFKPAIIEHINEVTQKRSSQLEQKQSKVSNKKPIKLSKIDRIIAINQMSIDNFITMNNQIHNLGESISKYNLKQQNLISQQKIFFYLLIALVVINFLQLFK